MAGFGVIVHRIVHRGHAGMTPLAGYIAIWVAVAGLYVINPLALNDLDFSTWILLAASIGSFTLAYAAVIRTLTGLARPDDSDPLMRRATFSPLIYLWFICAVFGLVLFMVYIFEVARTYGFHAGSLTALRVDLGRGRVPLGFYFFVFAEPLVPISAILALRERRHPGLYIATALLAALALLTTSGRSNAIFALVWTFSSVMVAQGSRVMRMRSVVYVVVTAGVALALFAAVGNAVGKTYENSPVYARFGANPPIPAPFVEPYLYLVGPLPAFNAVVRDTHQFGLGRNSFRPLFEIVAVFDHRISVPPHIQPFQLIPYPFNESTYLSPMYRDFGAVGAIFGSALIGGIAALLYAMYWRQHSLAGLAIAGFGCALAIATTGDLILLDLSRVVELAAVVAAYVVEPVGIVGEPRQVFSTMRTLLRM